MESVVEIAAETTKPTEESTAVHTPLPTVAYLREQLQAPFNASEIRSRIGSKSKDGKSGQVLAYVSARAVMDRLDSVLGPDNWQDHLELLDGGKGFICRLGVRFPGSPDWIWKEDVADMSAVEAIKGGASDAFKRAAIKHGVGRYLYELESPWVKLENGFLPRNFQFPLPMWARPLKKRAAAADGQAEIEKGATKADTGQVWNSFEQKVGDTASVEDDDGLL